MILATRSRFLFPALLWSVDDALDDGLSIGCFSSLGSFKRCQCVGKLVSLSDERFQIDQTTLNEGNGKLVVSVTVSERPHQVELFGDDLEE